MLTNARLYGILDLAYVTDVRERIVLRELLSGGIDVIQLRGKDRNLDELTAMSANLRQMTSDCGIPFIINDHAAVARRIPFDGVHVGQEDASIAEVRAQVARPILVGKSTHSIAQAVAAEREGADYIGFGPLFATPTKPEYQPIGTSDLRELHQRVRIPIFCIGGIKLENLSEVIAAGAERVVIVSGLLQARDIAAATRAAKTRLEQRLPSRHESLCPS